MWEVSAIYELPLTISSRSPFSSVGIARTPAVLAGIAISFGQRIGRVNDSSQVGPGTGAFAERMR